MQPMLSGNGSLFLQLQYELNLCLLSLHDSDFLFLLAQRLRTDFNGVSPDRYVLQAERTIPPALHA